MLRLGLAVVALLALVAWILLADPRTGEDTTPQEESTEATAQTDEAPNAAGSGTRAIESQPFSGSSPEAASAEPGVVLGRVVDAKGRPVAEARIDLHRDPTRGENLALPSPRLGGATSDDAGRFRLEGLLRNESYRLRVEHAEHRVAHVRGLHGAEPATLRPTVVLRDGPSVVGRVSDGTGAPLGDALIEVFSIEVPGTPPLARRERSARTRPDGSFEVGPLAPGPKRVTAARPGHATACAENVRVTPAGATAPLEFVLERGLTISGTVREREGGTPVAGARLVARIAGAARPVRSRVNAGGKEGAPPAAPVEPTTHPASSIPVIDPHLARPVMDENGRMTVRPVWPAELARRAFLEVEATSAADGSFALGGLFPGSYAVSVASPAHHTPFAWKVEAGTAGLEIALRRRPSVRGRVVRGAEGEPVERFLVAVSSQSDPALVPAQEKRQVRDAEGAFGPLAAEMGTAYIHVWADGFAPSTSRGHRLEEGQRLEDVLVALEPGATVTGTVRDAAGRPVAGAVVGLREPLLSRERQNEFLLSMARRSLGGLRGHRAETDREGRYVLEAVPAALLQVQVTHAELTETSGEPFACPARGVFEHPDLVLVPGATIGGRVLDPRGRRVHVSRSDAEGPVRLVPVAADGTFRCRGLPAGTYRIFLQEAERPDPATFLRSLHAARTITVQAGAEAPPLTLGEAPPAPPAAPRPGGKKR